MTLKENEELTKIIRERLANLHPENCEYCGGFHQLRIQKDGMTIVSSCGTCSEILRRAHEIIRETRKEYGDPYF